MTTSTQVRPSVAAALCQLIDYAGLFPPAKLDVTPSLREYVEARGGSHAWMLGRFIVPESRIEELRSQLGSEKIALSVIVDAGSNPRAWFGAAASAFERIAALAGDTAISVEALEVPLPPLASARDTYEATIGQVAGLMERTGLRRIPAYLEIPRDERYAEMLGQTMTALRRYGFGAKVRCGGVVPSAFPSVEEVAAFLVAAHEAGVAYKATAGLHHPVRHYNEGAGATMHGFLNLLAGALFASDGIEAVAQIVAETDSSAFAFEDDAFLTGKRRATTAQIEAMRRAGFVAYGSCSFAEPIEDLTALHMLPQSE